MLDDPTLDDPAIDDPAIDVPCCESLRDPLGEDDAVRMATMLKALADPSRLRLLSIIGSAEGGWACACDLSGPLGRSQATVSHHLSTLVKAGLLEREQRGKWAWFRVRAERLSDVGRALTLTR